MDRHSRLMRQAICCLLLAIGAFLGGCASGPRTTVVLMPDEDGHVGAVVVSTGQGSQRIDQAYAEVTAQGRQAAPSGVSALGQQPMQAAYGPLLKAQPPKPITFILRFVLDSTNLTEESKAQVPAVLEAVRQRKPTEITVYGHADASGTEKRNEKLSAERANVVANLLRKSDPSLDRIEVQSFGDRAPLVPAEPGMPEPRNRRAEIVIL